MMGANSCKRSVDGWRVMGVIVKAVSYGRRVARRASTGIQVVEDVVLC
jgi:hypothetical protein